MSLSTLAKKPLALPLTDTVMLACNRCQPEMHPSPGRLAAPGLAVTIWTGHYGTEYLTVTHVLTGRSIVTACCLRGAWEAARRLAHPREFRWTAKRSTLAKRREIVEGFVLAAAGVEMFSRYECSACGPDTLAEEAVR